MPTVTKTQLTPRQAARQRGYSVVQKEDGSGWYVRVAYLDADGQRRSACKKHPTEAAAHKWAQATKTAIDAGEHLRKRPDSFDTLADQWVALKADQGVRPVTVEGYRSALAPARAAFGAKPVQQITPAMIRSLMSKLKGRGRATNRQCLTSVKSCFELAIDDGLLKANPAAKVKVTGRQPVEMRVLRRRRRQDRRPHQGQAAGGVLDADPGGLAPQRGARLVLAAHRPRRRDGHHRTGEGGPRPRHSRADPAQVRPGPSHPPAAARDDRCDPAHPSHQAAGAPQLGRPLERGLLRRGQ